MTESLAVWVSSFGAKLLGGLFALGFTVGFVTRHFSKVSDLAIMVLAGSLPVVLSLGLIALNSMAHGGLGFSDYGFWTSLVEFSLIFFVAFLGARAGIWTTRLRWKSDPEAGEGEGK